MAKPKITPFAQVLRLLETLTDNEKATLRDVLRPAPAPRAKKASKKKAATATLPLVPVAQVETVTDTSDDGPKCAACGHGEGYQDHVQPSPHYHKFDAGKKAKSAA